MAISLAKSKLRVELKNRLSTMKTEERARQSKIVTQKILESPAFQRSQRVCLYLSMAEEVSTLDILNHVLHSGQICFVPRYTKDDMQMLRLYSMEDYESLPLTRWNIRQPDESQEREEVMESGGLDLILVPGLGFTEKGDRLGRGKGFYDRYLKKVFERQQIKPLLMGLAFKEQVVDKLPTDETDFAVHQVVFSE